MRRFLEAGMTPQGSNTCATALTAADTPSIISLWLVNPATTGAA